MYTELVTRFVTSRAAAECSFQSVRALFGSQMDVERIHKKVRFVVKYRSFHNLFCVRCEPPVFLDCAPLFVVTGETLF